jgi:hypothetical protein|tara:strand:+ start:3304 stop:3435 length:132 start_codon:yes stop_codon:yes gene_type:complete
MSLLFAPIYILLLGLPIFLLFAVALLALELATLVRGEKENVKI